MSLIHFYMGNPTAGGTDGQLISEGDLSNLLNVGPLTASSNEESAPIKLAVRCDAGYLGTDLSMNSNGSISFSGANANKWALTIDNNGSPSTWYGWGQTLDAFYYSIRNISATNTIFWIKAKAISGENPAKDTTTKLVGTFDLSPV